MTRSGCSTHKTELYSQYSDKMSESDMKTFVSRLVYETSVDDFSKLTQRIIRQQYLKYAGLDSLDSSQKERLRDIVLEAFNHANEERQKANHRSTEQLKKAAKKEETDDGSSVDYDKVFNEDVRNEVKASKRQNANSKTKWKKRYRVDTARERVMSKHSDTDKSDTGKSDTEKSDTDNSDSYGSHATESVIRAKNKSKRQTTSKRHRFSSSSEGEEQSSYTDTSPEVLRGKNEQFSDEQSDSDSSLPSLHSSFSLRNNKGKSDNYNKSDSELDDKSDALDDGDKSDTNADESFELDTNSSNVSSFLPQKSRVSSTNNTKVPKHSTAKLYRFSSSSEDDEQPSLTSTNCEVLRQNRKPFSENIDDSDSSLPSLHSSSRRKTDSDSEESSKENVKLAKRCKSHQPILISDSESEQQTQPIVLKTASVVLVRVDADGLTVHSNTRKKRKRLVCHLTDSSDDEERCKIPRGKKVKSERTEPMSLPEDKLPKPRKKKQSKKKGETLGSEERKLQMYSQIARECGVMPRGKRHQELLGNKTVSEKIDIIADMLEDAGMKGPPTMKKAQEIKLKKELESLGNIDIINVEGRARRGAKVKDEYSLW